MKIDENALKQVMEDDELESLEALCEWWLEHDFKPNLWESRETYESRKRIVLPIIIGEKLKRYESEYI